MTLSQHISCLSLSFRDKDRFSEAELKDPRHCTEAEFKDSRHCKEAEFRFIMLHPVTHLWACRIWAARGTPCGSPCHTSHRTTWRPKKWRKQINDSTEVIKS